MASTHLSNPSSMPVSTDTCSQQSKLQDCRRQVIQTEQFMRDLANGRPLQDISQATGIYMSTLNRRIALYALQTSRILELKGQGLPRGHLNHVRGFTPDQTKSILYSTIAKVMCGTNLARALLEAEQEEEDAILKEDDYRFLNYGTTPSWA